VCGGDVIHRDDDTEAAISRRLDLYERETAPILGWFEKRSLLLTVDGMGHPDDVTARLVSAVDAWREKH
jgi:adenylate kinase